MNTADKLITNLSATLLILFVLLFLFGSPMWFSHHGSGWMGSEYSQGMMHNWPANR